MEEKVLTSAEIISNYLLKYFLKRPVILTCYRYASNEKEIQTQINIIDVLYTKPIYSQFTHRIRDIKNNINSKSRYPFLLIFVDIGLSIE